MLKKIWNKEINFSGIRYDYYTTVGECVIALSIYTVVCCLGAMLILLK